MAVLALFKYGFTHSCHLPQFGALPQPFVAACSLKISGDEVVGFLWTFNGLVL